MMLSEVNILALLKRSSTVMTWQLEQLWKPCCVCVLLQWFQFTDDIYIYITCIHWDLYSHVIRRLIDEVEAVVPAWFSFITRMSFATLRHFLRLTAEVHEWAALKARQTEDGKILLRNFFGFIWLLKTSFNSHISSTNSSSILASPSPPMSRNTDVRFCSEPEARVCMPCTPCSFVLLLTVKKLKKDNSRSKPVHLSRHFLLPSVQKSLLNIM